MIFSREAGFAYYDETILNRLNARFRVFMAPFKAEFEGRSVLDLASHDGRWSYAALTLGAAHVTGIEGRADVIGIGQQLFENEPLRGRVNFIAGDIFDVLPRMRGEAYDIVLCLGIFYHVMDHYRLLKLMRDVRPSLIIVDGSLIDDARPQITLATERTDHILNAIAEADEHEAVVGIVSKGGLELMARLLGFDVKYLEWNASEFENKAGLDDYFNAGADGRRRFSAVLRKSART